MPASTRDRVAKHRDALRAAGMRPVQIWVPDTRQPGFAEEAARQAKLISEADLADPELMADIDALMEDAAEWT